MVGAIDQNGKRRIADWVRYATSPFVLCYGNRDQEAPALSAYFCGDPNGINGKTGLR